MGVLAGNDDGGFVEFDEAGADAHLQFGEELLDFVLTLDEFDFDG